jgi:large subunit ribosomal protein L10
LAITREKKEELVAHYKEQIAKSSAIVFTNYKGVNVAQVRALRAKLRDTGASYMVVKNTLMGIALEQSGRVKPEKLLTGTNGVIFMGDDIAKGATALKDWIKEAKITEITGALLESSILDAKQAETLSDLPTKDQVRGQLLGMLSAPASSLARMINAPGSSLARVLSAYAEKNQEAEAAAA